MKTSIRLSLLLALLDAVVSDAWAEVRLAGIFADHMVLQRERPIQVWGWADKGEEVSVEFAGQTAKATCGDDGAWSVRLSPLAASADGRELRVRGASQDLVVSDVVVGEVWHASGQSNMAMTVGSMAKELEPVKADIAAADLPAIRFCRINEAESPQPLDDLRNKATWRPCSPVTVSGFSGVAFYFARQLHRELGVPVGMIDSSRGGTPIEPFIPREAFGTHPTLRRELELGDQNDLDGIWKLPGGVRARDANWLPGRLFNSRLAPLARFAVRGAIWYQGESNSGVGEDPRDYQHKMRALITGWRRAFGDEQMPVYFVQLPGSGAGNGWPYLREQQRLAADVPHSGMVVTVDIDGAGIHPPNKIDVGRRLALWALANDYGKPVAFSGPMFERQVIQGDKITLHFQYAEGGLMVASKEGLAVPRETPDAELAHFELVDKDGVWWPADAEIDGKTVVVTSDKVRSPVAVRYAYAVTPENCNLYSRDGLPASPFCSDPSLLQYDPGLPK
ncbi:MAG: sialate O-acetylesterase [Planctomycetes bacterium]|nr:sialate O-acetylesterase [Planctomycetota bacterium]